MSGRHITFFRKLITAACLIVIVLGALYGLFVFPEKTVPADDLKIADDLRYTGDLYRGKFIGKGKLVFADEERGGIYEGDFTDGMFDGPGEFVAEDGWTLRGTFRNGEAVTIDELITEDGEVWRKDKHDVWQIVAETDAESEATGERVGK